MTNWILIALLCIDQAWGLRPKSIPKKSDQWLVKKSNTKQDQDDLSLLINEMRLRRSPSFLPTLLKLSEHPLDSVRRSSLEALIAYGPYLDDDRRDQVYLLRLNDNSIPISKLAQSGIRQRIQSEVNITFLVNALIQQCRSSVAWKDQLIALDILQWVSGEDIDALIVDMATHNNNPQVRRLAVQAIGERRMQSQRSLLLTIRNKDLDQSVRDAAVRSLQQIGGKVTDAVIAVMPFEIQQPALAEYASGFQNYLSGALSSANLATFVERGQVDKVMAELIYQDDYIDDNKAIEIGKSLRATQVITGNLQSHGNNVTITIKLIQVRNQEILHSAQVSGLLIDFDVLQRDASVKFMESL